METRPMEVSVSGVAEEEIRKAEYMKFVVADQDNQRKLILGNVGQYAEPHYLLVPDGAELVGGGHIQVLEDGRIDAEWDSESCFRRFGYDRPDDENKCEEVLEEVRSSLEEWMQRTI